MKLKMRTKIRGGLLLVFLISMLVGVYAAFAVSRITDYIAQMENLTHANNHVTDMVMAHHIWISRITESFMFGTEFPGGLDPTSCIWGQWRYGDQIYAMDDPIIMSLIQAIDHPHARLHLDGAEALRLREEGRIEEAFDLLQNVVLPYGIISTTYITALSDRYGELWAYVREDLRLVGGEVMQTVIIIFAAALGAFFVLSYLIPKSILKPVSQLAQLVSDVTVGKINYNRNIDIAEDEIGELINDTYALADVIKNIVEDLATVYKEYIQLGNIHYNIDDSKYSNSFNEMTGLVNKLLTSTTADIVGLAESLNHIGNGDFDRDIQRESWVGDWVFIPDAFDNLIANLKGVSAEVSAMIEAAAVKGDLDFKTDADKYSGDWRRIMTGLNDIAKAVDEPLKVLAIAMGEMRAGNFDIQAIDRTISGMGYKADASYYSGSFKAIIDDFENTASEISSYINEVSNDLEAISRGDLTTEITREYQGSFTAIKNSLNHISTSLNRTIREISVAAGQVLSGANQIATSATQLASGAQEQASSVQQLNTSIDIINEQTRQNADSASTARDISYKSALNAKEGNEAMNQTVEAMVQIKESSDNISKIIKTIQNIAFQTNLLALNASVEAARAGEQGKGFSVVADEVRSLAGRSEEAANETTTLIQDSIERVEIGSGIAESSSKSLDAIVASSGEVSDIIEGISTASHEQAEAIALVSTGLEEISKVTQNNSAVSQETAAASQELNSQAEILQQLVSYFKL